MTQTSSLNKRQANRRNALHSTGPRTDEGKRRSAINALQHGLSTAGQWLHDDPKVQAIADFIEQEGIEQGAAQELAQRIVNYEINLEHQRKLFLQSPKLAKYTDPMQLMQESFGNDVAILDDSVMQQEMLEGSINKQDLRLLKEMKKLMLRVINIEQRQQAKALDLHNSMRYLKRSSNQLIKGFKALKPQS